MASYYGIELSEVGIEDNSFSFTASITPQLQLQVEGHWDDVLQYQYDIIKNRLMDMAHSSPLNKQGEYIRDYDYINYYLSLPALDLISWLDSNPVIPNDIKNQPQAAQVGILQDRIAFCKDLYPILTKYEEGLRWNVDIKDGNGNTTASVIQPGGWFRNQADDYSFVYLSTKERVGINDLPYTILIVRLNND